MAGFNDDTDGRRKVTQRLVKAASVAGQRRRELKQDGAEFGLETLGAFKEASHGLGRLDQAAHVGEIPAHLDRHGEAAGGLRGPLFERFLLRQPIEGTVDLHRGERLGIMAQPIAAAGPAGRTHLASRRTATPTFRCKSCARSGCIRHSPYHHIRSIAHSALSRCWGSQPG